MAMRMVSLNASSASIVRLGQVNMNQENKQQSLIEDLILIHDHQQTMQVTVDHQNLKALIKTPNWIDDAPLIAMNNQ